MITSENILNILDLKNTSMESALVKYPNVLSCYTDIIGNLSHITIKSMIQYKYDMIYYVPWKYLTETDITSEIQLHGYFRPLIGELDEDTYETTYNVNVYPLEEIFSSSSFLINLIQNGKGFGYILDYNMTEYIQESVKTAIQYMDTQNRV